MAGYDEYPHTTEPNMDDLVAALGRDLEHEGGVRLLAQAREWTREEMRQVSLYIVRQPDELGEHRGETVKRPYQVD